MINKTDFRASGLGPSPAFSVYPEAIIERNLAMLLPGRDRQYTPLSNHLFERLRPALKEYIPEDRDYEEAFDRLQYLCSLRYWESTYQNKGYDWAPAGAFVWRSRIRPEFQTGNKLDAEIQKHGDNWPPLKFGLFQGPLENLRQLKEAFDKFMQRYPWRF